MACEASHARQPLGEILFREAKSTGTCISWKAPGGLVSGNHGELWVWPGPYVSSPPRASPEPPVTGAAGGVLGGEEPRASWAGRLFLLMSLFPRARPYSGGVPAVWGSGWGAPMTVSVTVSCDRSARPQHPAGPPSSPGSCCQLERGGCIRLITALETHRL